MSHEPPLLFGDHPSAVTGAIDCHVNIFHRHRITAHRSDLAHNPWSELCVKRLPGEPSCPLARCRTCDRDGY